MIIYNNMTGQRVKHDEVIEAIEMTQGHAITGNYEAGSKLDVIKLKLKKNGRPPVTIKGYQDTRITAHDDGSVNVEHDAPGVGALRFEADKYLNRIARIARTEHNMRMLVRGYRDRTFDIVDSHVASEVNLKHKNWWNKLGPSEKEEILEREKLGGLTPHQMPSNWTQRGNPQVEKYLRENTEQADMIKAQAETIKALEDRLKRLETGKTEDSQEIESFKKPVKSYADMTPFELRTQLKEKGIKSDRSWKKNFMIELLESPNPEGILNEVA